MTRGGQEKGEGALAFLFVFFADGKMVQGRRARDGIVGCFFLSPYLYITLAFP